MNGPQNGFEFLAEIRKQNGKKEQNFKSFFDYLDLKAREQGIPLNGQFELTPLCNFSCKMCYVHLNAEQMNGKAVLSSEIWKDLMYQAWETGMMHATLTGGECLTYPGFDELYLYLHSLGCDIGILTNGYLLDDKRIDFFLQHMPTRIQITLYGWNDDVYERVTGQRVFNTVVENVRKAISAGLPVTLTITPNRFLGEDVFETVRVAKSITNAFSLNTALFPPREETGRAQQRDDLDADFYIRIRRAMRELDGQKLKDIDAARLPPVGGPSHECTECGLLCGGGRSGFVMDWKGTLFPCNRMEIIHAYPLQEGFKAAWLKVNRAVNEWPRVPECEGCSYRMVCNTCAATMLQYAKPGKQPIKMCELTKYYVQHGVMCIPECEE